MGQREIYDLPAPGPQGQRAALESVGGKVEPGETKEQVLIREGTPQKLEYNDIRWITVNEIDQYAFYPTDNKIFTELKIKFENVVFGERICR